MEEESELTGFDTSESLKMGSLSRMFLVKVAELIYENRSPFDLSDFTADIPWFSLKVRKSPQLRQILPSDAFFGWFKIDIILSETNYVLERWYLIHLSTNNGEGNDKKEIFTDSTIRNEHRKEIYEKMSQNFRGIHSLLNVIPTKTLILMLNQMPSVTNKIKVVCSQFNPLPATKEVIPNFETTQVRFGPIQSPIGKTLVFCTYVVNIDTMIPRPIDIQTCYASSMSINDYSKSASINSKMFSSCSSFSKTIYSSALCSLRKEDSYSNALSLLTSTDDESKDIDLPDFENLIRDNCVFAIRDSITISEIRNRFNDVQRRLNYTN